MQLVEMTASRMDICKAAYAPRLHRRQLLADVVLSPQARLSGFVDQQLIGSRLGAEAGLLRGRAR